MMNSLPLGMYVRRNSVLHDMSSSAKLWSALFIMVSILLCRSFTALLLPAVPVLLGAVLGKCGKKLLFGLWKARMLFAMIFLLNVLFFSGEPDGSEQKFWVFTLSASGAWNALNVICKLLLLIVLTNILTMTTMPLSLAGSMERALQRLKFLHFPAQEISLMISMALRFIPLLVFESGMIKKGMISRRGNSGRKNLFHWMQNAAVMTQVLIISSFRRARETAQALEVRNYALGEKRAAESTERLNFADWCSILLCVAVMITETVILL